MRLSEREAIQRQNRGIVTMADMDRARRSKEIAEDKAEKRRQKKAKEATKGPALPLGEEGPR